MTGQEHSMPTANMNRSISVMSAGRIGLAGVGFPVKGESLSEECPCEADDQRNADTFKRSGSIGQRANNATREALRLRNREATPLRPRRNGLQLHPQPLALSPDRLDAR